VEARVCIVGFGHVGRHLARLLLEQEQALRAQFDLAVRVTGVASRRMGFQTDPGGLDLAALLADRWELRHGFSSDRVASWLEEARATALIELSSLDPHTGEPATTHLRAALRTGCHGITANKGPLVHAYDDLAGLARASGVAFRFEAATCDCVPVYSLFREALPLARLTGFRGLVNNTTSVILETIERGGTFAQGVVEAQSRGVAESDPSHDVDGFDSTVKLLAIARVLMGVPLRLEDVERVGIRELDPDVVVRAARGGTPMRLVASLARDGGVVRARVAPTALAAHDPFARLDAMALALHFETDILPGLTLVGHGLDARSTAYGVLCDLVNVARGR
jgi:homoserine dehydrogenase